MMTVSTKSRFWHLVSLSAEKQRRGRDCQARLVWRPLLLARVRQVSQFSMGRLLIHGR